METNLTISQLFLLHFGCRYFLIHLTVVNKTRLDTIKVLAGVLFAIGVIPQACSGWKPDQKEESNMTNTPARVSLASEVDANYTQLQNLLTARRYKEADQETTRMMLFVARREEEGWLDTKAIGSFPCQDLRTIDQLWVQNSNGRFGFSVQRQVYNQVGKDLVKFADQVEWRVYGAWKNYDELMDEEIEKAPQAHLPIESFIWELASPLGIWAGVEWGTLFSRVETCKM